MKLINPSPIIRRVKTFLKEEKGQTFAEYTILIIMVFYFLSVWCKQFSDVIINFANEIFNHIGLP